MFYTGIGARKTPKNILLTMTSIAGMLDKQGYTLRSGGAGGADSAFEEGVKLVKPEIYLPWKGFQKSTSDLVVNNPKAFKIAAQYHPAWERLSNVGQKFMARNVHQILGWDLKTLSNFVICWTKDGYFSGGTGQALRISEDYKIPIYNLFNNDDVVKLVGKILNSNKV